MELYYTKSGHCMIPADDRAKEWHDKQPAGEWLLLRVSSPRNVKFHRKAMALLNYAYDNSEQEDKAPFDAWRRTLTIAAGYYDIVVLPSGNSHLEAKSIAFAAMDEETFSAWYSAMIDAILKHVLTEHTRQDVIDNVLGFD